MDDEKILLEKQRFVRLSLKKYPFVKIKKHPLKNSVLEGIFSRGDRRLSKVLIKAWENGARFDSWSECFNYSFWEKAFASEGIDQRPYLSSMSKDAVLPWDHIDTGLKKSYLLQEFEKALQEIPTPSCLEKKCRDCMGCTLSSFYEKKYSEKLEVSPKHVSYLGKKTDEIIRYRAFYSKAGKARYISHIDLNNLIQRCFRRAKVSVLYSKGFHPKMLLSFPPALSLGMQGLLEVLEFKSRHDFSEAGFISRMNDFLPAGVKFKSLKKLDSFSSSLNEDLTGLVYSVDLENAEVRAALDSYRLKSNVSGMDDCEAAEKMAHEYLLNYPNKSIIKIKGEPNSKKLYITFKFSPQQAVRPKAVVENILGIKNPVFYMTREKLLFKDFPLT
jgi:radical SAM-linked protein